MKIKQITAREEKSSSADRGVINCEVHLTNGVIGSATVSVSSLCNDTDATQSQVIVADVIESIQETISPFFEGKVIDLMACDAILEEIYSADSPSLVPFSIITTLSIAISKAAALADEMELFELFAELSQNETITVPYPFFQLTDERVFDKNFPLQKIFLLPLGASSFRHSIGSFEEIQKKIDTHKIQVEGNNSPEKILESIHSVLAESKLQDVFVIGIHGNADVLYDEQNGEYAWIKTRKNGEELLAYYKNIIENYGVFSIQNGFAHADILGARTLLEICGDRVQLVSNQKLIFDDIPAIEQLRTYANACVIRPNDYLTVTKALTHVMYIRHEGVNVIVAPSTSENLSFIVDFAVGTSAGQIQTFSDNKDNTKALFDRLMDVEDTMTFSLL